MLAMAGQPLLPEQHVDGFSLAPLLGGEGKIDRETLFWHFPHHHRRGGKSSNGGGIRKANFKLVEFFGSEKIELYDLEEDIGEIKDLAPSRPAVVEALRAELENWRRQVGAKIPAGANELKAGK